MNICRLAAFFDLPIGPVARRWRRTVSLCAVVLSVSALDPAQGAVVSPYFGNPLPVGGRVASSVVSAGKTFYALNPVGNGIQVLSSEDLVNWQLAGRISFEGLRHYRRPGASEATGGASFIFNPNTRRYEVYGSLPGTDEILVWTARDPSGPWAGPHFVAFGRMPSVFVDPVTTGGQHALYMVLGGERTLCALTTDGTACQNGSWVQIPAAGNHPTLTRRGNWYYLTGYVDPTGLPEDAGLCSWRTQHLTSGGWTAEGPKVIYDIASGTRLRVDGGGTLISTGDGNWYVAFGAADVTERWLGSRLCLEPIEWTVSSGWKLTVGGRAAAGWGARPALPVQGGEAAAMGDEFSGRAAGQLSLAWYQGHQALAGASVDTQSRPGWLRLELQPGQAGGSILPGALWRSVCIPSFDVTTRVDFDPQSASDSAGLALRLGDGTCYRLQTTVEGGKRVCELVKEAIDSHGAVSRQLVGSIPETGGVVDLKIAVADGSQAQGFVASDGKTWVSVGSVALSEAGDKSVSANPAVGLFACGPQSTTNAHADFDYLRIATHPVIANPFPKLGDPLTTGTMDFATGAKSRTIPLVASGGQRPYVWSVVSGALPTGISLEPTTGVLRGTFSAAGDYHFVVGAIDRNGESDSRALSIKVLDRSPRLSGAAELGLSDLPGRMRHAIFRHLGPGGAAVVVNHLVRRVETGALDQAPWAAYALDFSVGRELFRAQLLESGQILSWESRPAPQPRHEDPERAKLAGLVKSSLGDGFRIVHVVTEGPASAPQQVIDAAGQGSRWQLTFDASGKLIDRREATSIFALPERGAREIGQVLAAGANPELTVWTTSDRRYPYEATVLFGNGRRVTLILSRRGYVHHREDTAVK